MIRTKWLYLLEYTWNDIIVRTAVVRVSRVWRRVVPYEYKKDKAAYGPHSV